MVAPSSAASGPPLLRWALAYARNGWPILPVRARAKLPLTAHGVKNASTDAEVIQGWWQHWPQANIGLAIPAGFVVVDLDSPDAMHRLKAEDRVLPATVRARTARGAHFWYRAPGRPRNRVGIVPGVDLRAVGGYVLVPPSVHPSSALYRWEVPLERDAIAEAPEWLEGLLAEESHRQRNSAAGWLVALSEPVLEGRRNQTLARVAGLLFRRLPAQVAAELAYCWVQVRMTPPLQDREIRRTLDSIASRELRRREQAHGRG